jgi:hypothetical protein
MTMDLEAASQITLKDMIVYSITKIPQNQGNIEEILNSMIEVFGKEKVCEMTS